MALKECRSKGPNKERCRGLLGHIGPHIGSRKAFITDSKETHFMFPRRFFGYEMRVMVKWSD